MTKTRICKCNHIMTNHNPRGVDRIRSECIIENCDCKQYIFSHHENHPPNPSVRIIPLPQLKKKYQKIYSMANLNSEGRPRIP